MKFETILKRIGREMIRHLPFVAGGSGMRFVVCAEAVREIINATATTGRCLRMVSNFMACYSMGTRTSDPVIM